MSFRKTLLTALPLLALALMVVALSRTGSEGAVAGSGQDSDGDGFPDSWETGTTPQGLNMAALGANPNRADVFLEVDFMKNGFRNNLSCSNLNKIYAMFNNSSVNAGVSGVQRGITIHIDAGKQCPGGKRDYDLGGSNAASNYTRYLTGGCSFSSDFSAAFDTSGRAVMAQNRRDVFHHAFFADEISSAGGDCDPLGVARARPGRQFLVGNTEHKGFGGTQDIRREIAGTLAHELGHDLGLTHGGGAGEENPFKPNHLSIMDYNHAGGIFKVNGGRKFDYQRWPVPQLNELNLNEAAGLKKPYTSKFRAAYYCGGGFRLSNRADRNIDWNCNGDAQQSGVNANIDRNEETFSHKGTPNEWKLIDFGGSSVGGGEIGVRAGLRTMSTEVETFEPGDEPTIDDRPH